MRRPRLRLRLRRRDERGFVAVLTALLIVPLIGITALTVDVGQWYVTARAAQRAADAGALAGVPYLPGSPQSAFSTAQAFTAKNGFDNTAPDVSVSTSLDNGPTQLKVSVSKTVPSVFGQLFGVSAATITRSATADYSGPVALGSPCNEYGNDPESSGKAGSVCSAVSQFWGNVGSPAAAKSYGDAYQDKVCASGTDGCTAGVNSDYETNGYFYTVTVDRPVANLVIEAFDPALVHVGDLCDKNNLSGAKGLGTEAVSGTTPSTRYVEGKDSPYCTGDISYSGDGGGYTNIVNTQFTVRNPGPNPWDPTSFPVRTGCSGTGVYPGYAGDLKKALDTTNADYQLKPMASSANVASAGSAGYVASVFRRWVPLCTIANAQAGTYMVQVKTNGLGVDGASGHNRFALRAYSATDSSARESVAIAGYSHMAIYANLPNATTSFYLARVPSGASGQVLNLGLFDVGDSSSAGTIRILAPPASGVSFTNCQASGVSNGLLPSCQLTNVGSNYNAKWQTVSVPIPAGYSCNDLDPDDCWVRLQYAYGSGNQPTDTTSWVANIEGDPVRLVK